MAIDWTGWLCHVPGRLSQKESELFRTIHGAHCARRHESHECSGSLTINRGGVTLNCPLCGDARNVHPPDSEG